MSEWLLQLLIASFWKLKESICLATDRVYTNNNAASESSMNAIFHVNEKFGGSLKTNWEASNIYKCENNEVAPIGLTLIASHRFCQCLTKIFFVRMKVHWWWILNSLQIFWIKDFSTSNHPFSNQRKSVFHNFTKDFYYFLLLNLKTALLWT